MATTGPSYAAIIDAGSSSSRLFIYQWQSEVALGEPLSILKVFPPDKKSAEAGGGIQHKEKEMETYLTPILAAGATFLQEHNITNVPLYLLATGGMRLIDTDAQTNILRAAHGVMSGWPGTFSVGKEWETNTRVIPGSVEGLYGWVALNYGKSVKEQVSGLLELGGASMQIAYQVPQAQVHQHRVCLLSGEHRVFSKTWDGFGADSTERRMLGGLIDEAGGPDGSSVIKNPCLPIGQVGSPVPGTNRTTIGSGEFATCLRLARGLLQQGLKTRDPIPSYLDIAFFSKHFYGVSDYWYNYQFFAKWGAYDVNRAYDRKAFTGAVEKYCSSNWEDIPWAVGDKARTVVYTEHQCWHAAWMLTLLHDDKYGFGLEMTQYDTWKSLFRFPTTNELASRSSWTVGATALIARHGELSLCPSKDDGSDGPPPVVNNTVVESVPRLQVPSLFHTKLDHSDVVNVQIDGFVVSSYNVVVYGVLVVLLAIIGWQYRQIRASRRVVWSQEKNISLA